MPLLELRDINKTYNQRTGNPLPVLRNIQLAIEPGDFVSIMGRSGSGKSTLLNIIGLLDMPDSGTYLLGGRDITRTPRSLLPRIRALEIGFVFQSFNLLPRLSVFQNVTLPLIYAGKDRAFRARRVHEVLEIVNLTNRTWYLPSKLSGGEQQRVAVARAIVNDPKMVVADEPTGNLDSESGHRIMRELVRLNQEGRTVVLVTHEPDIAAYARDHFLMSDGVLSRETHVA
jgi:putative ABC transport system ATP-binding protein